MLPSRLWDPDLLKAGESSSWRIRSGCRGASRQLPCHEGAVFATRVGRCGRRYEATKFHSSPFNKYLDGVAFHDDDEEAASDDAASVVSMMMMEDDVDWNKSSLPAADCCYASPDSSSSTCIAISAIPNARPTTGTFPSGTKRCSTGSG